MQLPSTLELIGYTLGQLLCLILWLTIFAWLAKEKKMMHFFKGKDRRRFARRAEKARTVFKKNARRAWGWCNTVPGRSRMKSKRLYWYSMANRIKVELMIWNHHTMTPLERKLHKAGLI